MIKFRNGNVNDNANFCRHQRKHRITPRHIQLAILSDDEINTLTKGIMLKEEDRTAETIAARWTEITDRTGETVPQSGSEQGALVMGRQGEIA